MISFQYPILAYLSPLATILIVLFFYYTEKRGMKRLTAFASQSHLNSLLAGHSRKRFWFKNSLSAICLGLIIFTLARPQWGIETIDLETESSDVLIALDTSKSMLAEDLSPNRLDRSKLAILDLLDVLEGDRIGIIAFSGEAFLQCPLTLDYTAFSSTLESLDTRTIPVGGTDIARAIEEAISYFETQGNNRNLILMTDGEDLEGRGLAAAKEAKSKGITIHSVGVGDTDGDLIPTTGEDGRRGYLRDAEGNPVKSSLDPSSLIAISNATGGQYFELKSGSQNLVQIYKSLIQKTDKTSVNETQEIPIERFTYPLVLVLFLLFIETVIGTRRKPTVISLIIFPILFFSLNPSLEAQLAQANKAFKGGDYPESANLYASYLDKNPENAKAWHNQGLAYFHAKEYRKSAQAFRNALNTGSIEVQESAFYNLSNALIQNGESLLETNPETSLKLWKEAVHHLENAQSLNPSAEDIKENLELIRQRIQSLNFKLSLEAKPETGGEVSSNKSDFFYKIPIEIKAIPADGYRFKNWDGIEDEEDAKTAEIKIRLSGNSHLIGNFIKTWNLTVESTDSSKGEAKESGTYDAGEAVPIKAMANDYFVFKQWKSDFGKIEDEKAAETTITLDRDTVVKAEFVEAFKLSIDASPKLGATQTSEGFYEVYSVAPLSIQVREGFEWIGWEGEGIENPKESNTSITMTEDKTTQAKLERIWNLVLIPTPENGGTLIGGGNYPVGEKVKIEAQAAEGFEFIKWEGKGVSDPDSATTTVTVQSEDHNVFCYFEQSDQRNDENQDQQNQEDQQDSDNDQNQDQNDNSEQNENESDSSEDEQKDSQENDDPSSQNENQDTEKNEESQPEGEETETQEPENTDPSHTEEEATEPQTSNETQQIEGLSEIEAYELLNRVDDEKNILPLSLPQDKNRNSKSPKNDW